MHCNFPFRAFILITLLFVGAVAQGQTVEWQNDLENAKQQADKEGKLVLIHFYADWCGPCKQLDSFVFNSESVARNISESFVPVKIDIDVHPDLVADYNVKSIPFDVAITPNGNIVHRQKSPKSSDNYLTMVSRLSKMNSHMSNPNALDAQMFAPQIAEKQKVNPLQDRDTMQFNSSSVDFRPSGQIANVDSSGNSAGGFRPRGQSARPTGTVDFVHNDTMKQPSIEGTFRSAGTENEFRTNTAKQTLSPRQSGSPIASQPERVVNNKFVDNSNNTASNPVFDPSSIRTQTAEAHATIRTEPRQMKPQQPTAPLRVANTRVEAPAPKTSFALSGNCPVSLLTISKWVPGNENFGCVHRGKTYLFASREHMETFLANPDQYSPVLAGYDPVAFSEQGEFSNGKESLGVFMSKGGLQKIVLFDSAENRAKFQEDPKKYLEAVRVATEQVDQGQTINR